MTACGKLFIRRVCAPVAGSVPGLMHYGNKSESLMTSLYLRCSSEKAVRLSESKRVSEKHPEFSHGFRRDLKQSLTQKPALHVSISAVTVSQLLTHLCLNCSSGILGDTSETQLMLQLKINDIKPINLCRDSLRVHFVFFFLFNSNYRHRHL